MKNSTMTHTDHAIFLQTISFFGALVTYVQPIISMVFMVVSIVSGCILIYKFFTKKDG